MLAAQQVGILNRFRGWETTNGTGQDSNLKS